MALTKLTADLDNIQALSDKPNEIEGLTADQLKAKFDKGANDIKDYINDTLIDELDTSITDIDTAQTDINNAEAVIGNETDTYSASSTYALGDLVIYNSLLYKCTTAITVAEAWMVAHWTQVSLTSLAQSGDVYSTTEQKIGTWIDGKPIYRKVITGIHNDDEVLISNVSSLITAYGQSDNGTGLLRNIPWLEFYQSENYAITVNLVSNNIILNSKLAGVAAPTSSRTALIIEYTKTTD